VALPPVNPGSQSARGFAAPPTTHPTSTTMGPENHYGMKGEALDLLRILENHRRECEKTGDFESAKITRERLGKLRLAQVKKQKNALMARHQADKEALLQELDRGMQEFLDGWRNVKVSELDAFVEELLRGSKERAEIELRQFQTSLNAKPFKPKFSPEVLDLQRRMECLGQQEMYQEAKKLKKKIEQLQEVELLKTHATRLKMIEVKEASFKEKQAREMSALHDRIRNLRMEKARQQEREFRELKKQQQSTLAFLEQKHSLERSRLSQEARAVLEMNTRWGLKDKEKAEEAKKLLRESAF